MQDERDPTDFEAAMRQFRADFEQQLPTRLADARARLAACLEQPGDDQRLHELHLVVHKLVGAAGTFGMMALADAAQVAEGGVLDLLERQGRSASDFDGIAAAIEATARLAERP
jgi:chemotaxis protein histidine kinase CheA